MAKITLTWSPSSDNVGVAGYRIRRDDVVIATVSGGVTSYDDVGLADGVTYSYTVQALDPAGNESAESASASDTTLNPSTEGKTWAEVIAYTATLPSFTPLRTFTLAPTATFADFDRLVKNALPGDEIDASACSWTYHGEYTVYDKHGTADHPIRVILGTDTIFAYNGGDNLPALYMRQCSYVQWFDGKYTTSSTGGEGILVVNCHDVVMWIRAAQGGKIYDCGGDGAFASNFGSTGLPYTYNGSAVTAGNYRCSFHFGEITNCGLAWATRDPHVPRGSGFHGVQFADNVYGNYDCTLTAWVHDHAYGAGIQAGGSASTDGVYGCTIAVKGEDLTDARNIDGGNGSALQLWGKNVKDNQIVYVEANDCAGRAVNTGGLGAGQSLSTNTVQYGIHTNCCTHLAGGTSPWDSHGSPVYVDVDATPGP